MRLIKYVWYNAVMLATAWLPDLRPVLQLRGFLARPAFKKCGANFQIAHGVLINFPNCLEIGRDVYFGPGSWIHAPGGIVVEDEVQLGPYVVLITGDHTLKNGSYRHGPGNRGPIRLCRGSWVAAHATVAKGVTVGRGALLAANAVAVKDVPDFCIAGGIPAKVIKENVDRGEAS